MKQKVFIIAEAGVNHNGELALAKKLADKAKEAGADAVKFQTFRTDKLVAASTAQAAYQTVNIGKEESQAEMLPFGVVLCRFSGIAGLLPENRHFIFIDCL